VAAEPTQQSDDPITYIMVKLAVIERLVNDHLKYHDKGTAYRIQLQVQGLMVVGIITDIVLQLKGH